MSVFLPKVPVGSGLVQRQPGPVHHSRPQVPDPKHRASLRHHPSQGEAVTGSAGAGGWENTPRQTSKGDQSPKERPSVFNNSPAQQELKNDISKSTLIDQTGNNDEVED